MSNWKLKAVFAFLWLMWIVQAVDVGGKVVKPKQKKNQPKIPHNRLDPSKMTAVLVGETDTYHTYVYNNGYFKFTNVPVGNYIMRVDDPHNFMDSVLIEVVKTGKEGKEAAIAYEYDIKNSKGNKIKHPCVFRPAGPKNYFEVKEPFNVMGLFKSPMVIMMLVSFGMMYLMNKMPKPDKEQMKEMNKNMSSFQMPSFLQPPS